MCVEIFPSSISPRDLQTQGIKKFYDRNLRGFVYGLDKSLTTTLKCHVQTHEPLILLQIRRGDDPVSFDVSFICSDSNQYHINISTSTMKFELDGFNLCMPWIQNLSSHDEWNTIRVDLEFIARKFWNVSYVNATLVIVRHICRVRRIFSSIRGETVPANLDFPSESTNVNPFHLDVIPNGNPSPQHYEHEDHYLTVPPPPIVTVKPRLEVLRTKLSFIDAMLAETRRDAKLFMQSLEVTNE